MQEVECGYDNPNFTKDRYAPGSQAGPDHHHHRASTSPTCPVKKKVERDESTEGSG